MADASDVSNVLVGLISGVIFPDGVGQPSSIGNCAQIFPGWPLPQQLDALIAAGKSLISIWPLPAERNTTRYLQQWMQAVINTPTLTLFASGQTVTVGGSIPPAANPHNAVIFVNGVPYVYAVQPIDALASIATALATLIEIVVPGTTSSGPVITLPQDARLGPCRIGVKGTSVKEIKRQEKQWQISIWTGDPALRDVIGSILDRELSTLTFINLPDYTAGRIRYFGTRYFDNAQKQGIYRRDLIYTVEYATTRVEVDTQVTQIELNVRGSIVPDPTLPPTTIYE